MRLVCLPETLTADWGCTLRVLSIQLFMETDGTMYSSNSAHVYSKLISSQNIVTHIVSLKSKNILVISKW